MTQADLSGICDTHGIALFQGDDGVYVKPEGDTLDAPNYGPVLEADKWYWATCQHCVLTGKPNGPYPNRATALANAAMIMAAYESSTLLAGIKLD